MSAYFGVLVPLMDGGTGALDDLSGFFVNDAKLLK